ncbi:hypothetical protein AMTR_s00070p00200820 [Amborella trichopoda]|uniref:Uncharacterized protein n=1 Tax=Amborella trichopoda TaxID=13333 RepID=U5DEP7_AMBTC|nr:hypothetical protein AMTR_s00070p00200820 [Amborella trichopoda]
MNDANWVSEKLSFLFQCFLRRDGDEIGVLRERGNEEGVWNEPCGYGIGGITEGVRWEEDGKMGVQLTKKKLDVGKREVQETRMVFVECWVGHAHNLRNSLRQAVLNSTGFALRRS